MHFHVYNIGCYDVYVFLFIFLIHTLCIDLLEGVTSTKIPLQRAVFSVLHDFSSKVSKNTNGMNLFFTKEFRIHKGIYFQSEYKVLGY